MNQALIVYDGIDVCRGAKQAVGISIFGYGRKNLSMNYTWHGTGKCGDDKPSLAWVLYLELNPMLAIWGCCSNHSGCVTALCV